MLLIVMVREEGCSVWLQSGRPLPDIAILSRVYTHDVMSVQVPLSNSWMLMFNVAVGNTSAGSVPTATPAGATTETADGTPVTLTEEALKVATTAPYTRLGLARFEVPAYVTA